MRRILIATLLAMTAITGCTNDPQPSGGKTPPPEEERALAFLVELPSAGKVEGKPASYASVSDPLAIRDESRLSKLFVYVFGLNPEHPVPLTDTTTDDYILEGMYPFDAPDVSSPAGQTNSSFVTVSGIRVKAGIKHLYFVGNDEVGILDGAPETRMINALVLDGGQLPLIDTIPGGGGEREVKAPGIPMVAWARVDATNTSTIIAPERVVLERSIARLDVINATINYYIIGAQLRAHGQSYLFDTIPVKQPVGMVWDDPSDYTHATGAWNVVPMPREYDWVFSQPELYDIFPLEIPPREADGDDYDAGPVATGYIYPTPPRVDIVEGKRAVYAELFLMPVDTLRYLDWPLATQLNPNYGLPAKGVQAVQIDIPFERNGVVEAIQRNHVYRVAVTESENLEVDFIVIEDWIEAQGAPTLHVPIPPTLDFMTDGVSLADVNGGNYCAIYTTGAFAHDTIDILMNGLSPHVVENANSALPVWLTLGAQVGDDLTEPTDIIFKNLNAGDPNAAPRWILDIGMQENTTGRDRMYSLYVRVGEKPVNPSAILTIIQRGS